MIVSKFGGTSVGSFEAMQRSAEIVTSNAERRLIIISATAGTTNQLIQLSKPHLEPKSREEILQQIEIKHRDIIRNIQNHEHVMRDFDHLFSQLKEHAKQESRDKRWKDKLLS